MSERDQVYVDEYEFLGIKTVKMKENIPFWPPKLIKNKDYIIFHPIWFILYNLEQVF